MYPTITLDTATLKRALQASERIAEKRSTIPVLAHVLIETDSQGARLSVTDLEVSRQERIKYAAAPSEPDSDYAHPWPTWSCSVNVAALKKTLPRNQKGVRRAPVTQLVLENGHEEMERKRTPQEIRAIRDNFPPKLSDGREPGGGELVGQRSRVSSRSHPTRRIAREAALGEPFG